MTDLYTSLEPVLQVCCLFGYAPFAFSNQSDPRPLRVSPRSRAYAVVLVALIGCVYALQVADLVGIFSVRMISTQGIVNNAQQTYNVFLVLLLIVTSNVNPSHIITLLHRIAEVDKRLYSIDAIVPYARHRRFAILQMVIGVLLTISNVVLMAWTLMAGGPITEHYTLSLYWTLYQTLTAFDFFYTLWFVDGVLLVGQRFAVINSHLAAMCNGGRREARGQGDRPWQAARARYRPLDAVSLLVTAHASLADLADAINSAHAPQLLLLVAASFVNLTTEINYFVFFVVSGKMAAQETVHSVFMIAIVVLQVVFLSLGCGYTSDKGNETADLVHDLLPLATSARLKDELELFSMQLVHRKVQFTACGFFPLDATLIFSIVAGVTTYMVILIQVQTSPK